MKGFPLTDGLNAALDVDVQLRARVCELCDPRLESSVKRISRGITIRYWIRANRRIYFAFSCWFPDRVTPGGPKLGTRFGLYKPDIVGRKNKKKKTDN